MGVLFTVVAHFYENVSIGEIATHITSLHHLLNSLVDELIVRNGFEHYQLNIKYSASVQFTDSFIPV